MVYLQSINCIIFFAMQTYKKQVIIDNNVIYVVNVNLCTVMSSLSSHMPLKKVLVKGGNTTLHNKRNCMKINLYCVVCCTLYSRHSLTGGLQELPEWANGQRRNEPPYTKAVSSTANKEQALNTYTTMSGFWFWNCIDSIGGNAPKCPQSF